MNIPQTRRLLAHVQIASALLAAIATGASLRVEAGSSLTADELGRLDAFWANELTNAIAELETGRRLVEVAPRSGKTVQP